MLAKTLYALGGVVLFIAVVIGAAGASLSVTPKAGLAAPSQAALADIPADYLALYQQAAGECPGLSWPVLAAIGKVESDHGRSTLPGVHGGANQAGAQGPMQFLPATFAGYDRPVPPHGADPPSPFHPVNAIHAAARYLCASGARDGRDLPGAIFVYNRSSSYVTRVLDLATHYSATPPEAGRAPAPEQATVPDPTGTGRLVTLRTAAVYHAAKNLRLIGKASCVGQRPELPSSDHPAGRACDFFFAPGNPGQVAAGWRLASWLTTNADAYQVRYVIWQGQIWQASQPGWRTYVSTAYGCPDPANLTGCHYDHVHLSLH